MAECLLAAKVGIWQASTQISQFAVVTHFPNSWQHGAGLESMLLMGAPVHKLQLRQNTDTDSWLLAVSNYVWLNGTLRIEPSISGNEEDGWKRHVASSDGSCSLHSDFSSVTRSTQQILETLVPSSSCVGMGQKFQVKFTSVVGWLWTLCKQQKRRWRPNREFQSLPCLLRASCFNAICRSTFLTSRTTVDATSHGIWSQTIEISSQIINISIKYPHKKKGLIWNDMKIMISRVHHHLICYL